MDLNAPPPMEDDWRSTLQFDSRQKVVQKITETFKRHIPYSGEEGIQELKQNAINYEEKIYRTATNQSDYLRKISLKMLTMESKSQTRLLHSLPSNSAGMNRNLQDTAMNLNSRRPAQINVPIPMHGGDWRSQLQPDSRQRIVNKIMETLKRHLPYSGEEGIQELRQTAIRYEQEIYSIATSQSDYVRRISLKMLRVESESQITLPNALPSNSAGMS